jgi:Lanthionine synthetase C-like protein
MAETLAHLAVSAATTRDLVHVRKFVSYVPSLLKASSRGSCDWLSGRAGTLYLLRVMRFFVPSAVDLVDPAIRSLTKTILRMGEAAGWEWPWYGKNYLGVAHGAVGIVTQLALSCDVAMQAETEASREDVWRPIRKILEGLLDGQLADGNWAPRLGSPTEDDELVQFCHGAPGFVVSFCALMDRGLFPELERMDDAVEEGRDAIWERGLLVKEPCLCHGITGNALALCGEQREHFLAYTTQAMFRDWQSEGVFGQSTDPWGLYGGLAGRAWGFLELLREKEGRGGANGGFIGYSDV